MMWRPEAVAGSWKWSQVPLNLLHSVWWGSQRPKSQSFLGLSANNYLLDKYNSISFVNPIIFCCCESYKASEIVNYGVIKAIINSIWLYQEFFIRSTSLTIIMAIKCLNRENTYLLCKGKYRYTYVLLFYLFKFCKTFKIVNNFIIKQLLNTNDTSTYNFSEYSLPSRDRAVGHVQTWARSSVTRWLDYLSIFGHL